jgi:histidine triad (HIT) family protein
MDCIFCKIVAGEIPNYTVYESENVLAFLDINPCTKGHTVVIPKKHFEKMSELGKADHAYFMDGLREAVERVDHVLAPHGFNIGVNDQPAAGQVVPHVHWHIFPRWKNDGGGSVHSIIKSEEKIGMAEVLKLFK